MAQEGEAHSAVRLARDPFCLRDLGQTGRVRGSFLRDVTGRTANPRSSVPMPDRPTLRAGTSPSAASAPAGDESARAHHKRYRPEL